MLFETSTSLFVVMQVCCSRHGWTLQKAQDLIPLILCRYLQMLQFFFSERQLSKTCQFKALIAERVA